MFIVHVLPLVDPAYGGPVHATVALAEAQLAAGDRVEIFTTDRSFSSGGRHRHEPASTPVPVRQVPVRSPVRWSRAPQLTAALEAVVDDVDVVHVHTVFHHSSNVAARVARRAGVPVVVEPHGSFTRVSLSHGRAHKTAYRFLLDDRMYRRAAGIRCASTAERDDLDAIGLGDGSFVVPHGVESLPPAEPTDGDRREDEDPPVVLFLGRLAAKKRLDLTVEAFAVARRRVPGAVLRIVGSDEDGLVSSISARAERLGVADAVVFDGARFGAQRADALRSASVFVLLSDDESFGMAPLEALCAGVPVVATPEVASMKDLAGRAAVRLVPQDPALAGDALADALTSDDLLRRARAEAPALSREFSWTEIAASMRRRYAELTVAANRT